MDIKNSFDVVNGPVPDAQKSGKNFFENPGINPSDSPKEDAGWKANNDTGEFTSGSKMPSWKKGSGY